MRTEGSETRMDHLTPPHGGELCSLLVEEERAEQLKAKSGNYPSITLGLRQVCDLELLLNGGFSPLRGFMTRTVHDSFIDTLPLPDFLQI